MLLCDVAECADYFNRPPGASAEEEVRAAWQRSPSHTTHRFKMPPFYMLMTGGSRITVQPTRNCWRVRECLAIDDDSVFVAAVG